MSRRTAPAKSLPGTLSQVSSRVVMPASRSADASANCATEPAGAGADRSTCDGKEPCP